MSRGGAGESMSFVNLSGEVGPLPASPDISRSPLELAVATLRYGSIEGAVSMRVISGTAGGRKLVAPEGDETRPITDRAKEGIFNMLSCYIDFEGLTVADLFAGSGSFGIEALSRGARNVTFVEKRPQAQRTIQKNLDTLGLSTNATIMRGSVQQSLARLGPVDLAFCDPPYALDEWSTLLPEISAEYVVGHAPFEIPLTEEWGEVRRRKYGRSRIVIAARAH